jgi:RNase H-like domain found in reverse transcriptase
MTTALILRYYNPLYKSILEIDAFDSIIASILSQLHPDGEWHPVAYFSKTMALTECNYEIYNKEMLAIIQSLL